MWLRSRVAVAVAVAVASGSSSNSTPSLGTSICRECGSKKQKKRKKKEKKKKKKFESLVYKSCILKASLQKEGNWDFCLLT